MVIDEIIVKNKQVDSLSNKTIDKIIFEGQEYNFAKPSDLVSSDITTDVELLDAVNEPVIYMDIKGKTVQDGIPTIENPIPMVSTSDSNIEVSIHSRNLVPLEGTVETSASSSVKSIDITDNIMRIAFNEEILPSYGENTYSRILTDKDLFDTYLTISFKYRSNRPDILVGFQIAYRETAQASITYPMRQTVGPAANGEVQTFVATTTSKIGKPGELFFYYVWKLPEPYQLNEDDYIEIFDVMIKRGSTTAPYQPYFEEAIIIPTSDGINLRSIDDVYDELIIENGTVKKIQRINEITFPANNTDGGWNRINNRVYQRLFYPNPNRMLNSIMLSDKLSWDSRIFSTVAYNAIYTDTKAVFYIALDGSFANLDEFLARYGEVNPKFLYVLDKPIETDITSTPIGQALLQLPTNIGTNILHIVSSSTNPSSVSTIYYKQIRP